MFFFGGFWEEIIFCFQHGVVGFIALMCGSDGAVAIMWDLEENWGEYIMCLLWDIIIY